MRCELVLEVRLLEIELVLEAVHELVADAPAVAHWTMARRSAWYTRRKTRWRASDRSSDPSSSILPARAAKRPALALLVVLASTFERVVAGPPLVRQRRELLERRCARGQAR